MCVTEFWLKYYENSPFQEPILTYFTSYPFNYYYCYYYFTIIIC